MIIKFVTANFKTIAASINYDGFDIDLMTTCTKGNLEKINKRHERKHKAGWAKFFKISATCGCCMRDDLTMNKATGKVAAHNMPNSQNRCWGANTEALEISDEGIIAGIRMLITLKQTIELHLRNAHKWSNKKVELEIELARVEAALEEKVEQIISYRDLRKKRAEEERAAAIKKEEEEKKALAVSAKELARKAYFAERCKVTTCPTCSAEANTEEEVESIFGLRKKTNRAGEIIFFPQSYCKSCRSQQNKIRRAKKKAEAAAAAAAQQNVA